MQNNSFRLDHIGIAVRSLEESLPIYELMGLGLLKQEHVPTEQVNVAFLDSGECHVELLEASSEESPIAQFIAKRGPGIHHLCVQVQDLPAVLRRLEDSGVQLIDKTPRLGANNKRVAFVHPKATGGVLIELSEEMPLSQT